MQWEWDPHLANPYHVGRVRLCFVTPPDATASMEPLGSLDVTQLPGLGHWLRFVLKDSVNAVATRASSALPLPLPLTLLTLPLPLPTNRDQVATHPNWLETDMRLSSSGATAAAAAATPGPASHAEPLQVVGASLLPGIMLELPVTPACPPRPPAAAAAATGSEQQDGPSESPQEW